MGTLNWMSCVGYRLSHYQLTSLRVSVSPIDVLFGKQVPEGVGKTTIDIGALKKLGDEQATKLAQALGV
jgi:hypothetical protein